MNIQTFLISLLLVVLPGTLAFGDITPRAGLDEPANKRLLEKAFKIQIPFIENQGQIADQHVRFYSKIFGGTVYVTAKGEMIYSLAKTQPNSSPTPGGKHKGIQTVTEIWAIKEELVGASINQPQGIDRTQTKVNYFVGNEKDKWKTSLATYNAVSFSEVYKGIDLDLKAHGKNVEKIFNVKPGADPETIKLKIEGATSLNINGEGELEAQTRLGPIRFARPLAYQEINGKRREVNVSYALIDSQIRNLCSDSGDNSELETRNSQLVYGFKTGDYDKSHPLVIDPVLAFSSYLGGGSDESGQGIAVDPSGNVYVTGWTESPDFPTLNPLQDSGAGLKDVFVAKIDATEGALVYSTYLGGSGDDQAWGIAVDVSGNVYLTGWTESVNFPTNNPYQGSLAGAKDAFVTKISASGDALVYSTYLGGSTTDFVPGDEAYGIAVDASGNAYVTGRTGSNNFPTTPGVIQSSYAGNWDAFVTKINASGNALFYSTYLGGSSGGDGGYGIAVDGSGNAYISGYTQCANFPTLNPIRAYGGDTDAFVAKINASGNALVYSTHLGGSGPDLSYGLAIDTAGNAYVTGYTDSPNFPTQNPIQGSRAGAYDAFVTKINASGSSLVYSTYLGGGSDDWPFGIAVDVSGNAFVTGWTESTDFPTASPIQGTYAGAGDGFVAKINASGNSLVYSTYLGGSAADASHGIAVDFSGNAYMTGFTSSINFPTQSPFQGSNAGGGDAFVIKVADTWAKTLTSTGYTRASAVDQTSDGGYIVSGTMGWNGDYAFVAKLNSDGKVGWKRKYDNQRYDYANAVQQTSDGGYIVAGFSDSILGWAYAWVLKLLSDGAVDWQEFLVDFYEGYTSIYDVQQTVDGGYVVAGRRFGNNRTSAFIIKLNPNGTVAWQKAYGGSEYDLVRSIQQTSDGGYIMAGTTNSFGAGGYDAWVLKLDANGNLGPSYPGTWQKAYGGAGEDQASAIEQTPNGGYIMAGFTNSFGADGFDYWVLRLDASGGVVWQKTYGGTGDDKASSIQWTSDGGYVVAGSTTSFGAGGSDAWVLRVDTNGISVWQNTYGRAGDDTASSVRQTSDGGYIVAGSTSVAAWLLRLDSTGNITGCPAGLIRTTTVSGIDTYVTGTPTSATIDFQTYISPNTSESLVMSNADVYDQNVCSDFTPATGSIVINGGAYSTYSVAVNLSISASDPSGVSRMCISNNTSCADWEDYAISKSWTLLPGDGVKTVYVWFQDAVGNVSTTPHSDSIVLVCSGGPCPDISVDPGSYDFGKVFLGSSMSTTFTISNMGTAGLAIDQVELFVSGNFSISNDACTGQTVSPGNECYIEVGFLPTYEGWADATLRIYSNDPDAPEWDVPLSGGRCDSASRRYSGIP